MELPAPPIQYQAELRPHALILPFLEQLQIYNALNFNFGSDASTSTLCYQVNQTGMNAQIKAFVCPCDPRAGVPDFQSIANTNNYYASVGTSMWWGLIGHNVAGSPAPNLNMATINMPSTGLFTWMSSYGIQHCTDGTSNTVAFSEAAVGYQTEQPRQRLIGLQGVQIPYTSILYDAETNPAVVRAVIQLCNAAYNSGNDRYIDTQRGQVWSHGCMAQALFNTIVTPNAYNDTWTHCGLDSSARAVLSNADSYHPGGVNTLMADGSVRFIKDSINQVTWWALGTKSNGEVISSDAY